MKKRILSVLLVLMMLLGIVGCNNDAGSTEESGIKTYTIELKSNGGKAFEKIEIHVFEDSSMTDLVAVGKTDANGVFTFDAEYSKNYVAVLKNMPAGYNVENYYTLEGTTLTMVFEAQLLDASAVKSPLKLGAVAADMTVKAADGTTYKISELLKTKEAVVLNFWYEACQPCKEEFPYMEEAYLEYSDKIEILAINTEDGDDASVAAYKAAMGLTFPMTKADRTYAAAFGVQACPTTIVIDRYGTIGFMHTGSVPNADAFRNLFAYFTADDYVQSTVKNLDDIVTEIEGGNGTKEYPYEEYRTEFEAEVEAGAEVYYQMYRVNGMILEIADEDAYVMYEGKKYEPVDGKVSLVLKTADTYTPAVFAIGNRSGVKEKFTATVSFRQGSAGNPFVMNLGAFAAKVEAGNEEGIYYTYTATENGTFSLQCTGVTTGVKYDFSLYNTVTSALHNLSSDGEGDGTVSILVNAGDVVQISVGVLPNDDNEIPATDFNFKASFVKGKGTGVDPNAEYEYKIVVTDQNGKPIPNVSVRLNADGAIDNIKTDASGVATISLRAGNYIVTVTAPEGYKEDLTEYIMTSVDNQLTVQLEKKATEKKTYTVTVVDENGKAIAGAGVTVGGEHYAKTDKNGKASFTLQADDYSVSVTAAGYTSDGKTYSLSAGATDVKVTLKKEVVQVKEVEYKVTVKDYQGNILKGVTVQFKNGDAIVATEVATNGVVTVKLPEGNYSARVNDETYGSASVKLTASKASAEVVAAKKMDTSKGYEDYFGMIYPIAEGAVYVDLNPTGDNYFVFEIVKAGKYEFKVTGVDTKIAPCGSTAFVFTPTYEGNVYTTEIKEGSVGSDIALSVTGESGAVIIVTRTGDSNETIYREFEGKAPSKFTMTEDGGKLTYVDVTASAFDIVLGADGYYHKGSANGPVVYVNLGSKAPYLSLQTMIQGSGAAGGTPLVSYTTENGRQVRIDYTDYMVAHFENMDATYGVYPLTEELKNVLQAAGEFNGWWDASNKNNAYLFTSVKNLNTEIAWMFACCYVE